MAKRISKFQRDTTKRAAWLFVRLGHAVGYCEAEFLLAEYLPPENPLGRVCDLEPTEMFCFIADVRASLETDDPAATMRRRRKKALSTRKRISRRQGATQISEGLIS